jgi:long-chain acyl-CoA synthetase
MTMKLLCDYLLAKEQECPDRLYLKQPRNGKWTEYSWREVMDKARRVASFLRNQGLKKGDKVSIVSKNCAEWFITDFGISLAGLVNIPLFPNQHTESINYVLEHGEVKFIFIGKLDDPKRIRADIPEGLNSAGFDYHELKVGHSWQQVMDAEPLKDLELPSTDDIYTIIYTSGTSGVPKGAVYTHGIIGAYLEQLPDDLSRFMSLEDQHLISYLPLAHIYERTAIQIASLSIDCDVSFVESLVKFADNLREVQPTIFTAVPRIWGVFQSRIQDKLPPKKLSLLLKIPLVSSLIKKKIRHSLGLNRCTVCVSGASHLPSATIEFFDKLGIRIQEGYGQTENMAYATLNLLESWKIGSVGSPRVAVEAKLGEHHELLLRSPCMMKGYFKQEKASKEAFSDEGFLYTGDIAEIDEHGRIKIIGRISETFKNQSGEFIKPSPIENSFSHNQYTEYLCLVGKGLARNIMLVTLSELGKKASHEEVSKSLAQTLEDMNTDLRSYEKIGHVVVIKDDWTPDNNFLTPTLKIKRHVVENNYEPLIRKAVKEGGHVYWQS